jgi:2-keto-3-deoxy-L-fuconate dehydrogenase
MNTLLIPHTTGQADMAFSLAGKVALITGAGQGIGRAATLLFKEAGAAVWATDVNRAALDELARDHPSLRTKLLDVTDAGTIRAAADETGPVDVLFNCAGFVHQGNILDCSDESWQFSFDLNIHSMFRMCRAFLPRMVQAGKGSIINMSSVISSVKGAPNRCAYGASKAAVIGLTKAIAADFVTKNIRCNALCPGTVDTPSLHDRIAAHGDVVKARESFVARQPMGRFGKAEEVAAAALYLASDESAFVTGQELVIDGGWSI